MSGLKFERIIYLINYQQFEITSIIETVNHLALRGRVYCAKVLAKFFLTLIFCAPIKL